MNEYFIQAFDPGRSSQVVELMASARRQRRRGCPLLPPGLDDPATAVKLLGELGDGVVALDASGLVAGFLFAEAQPDPIWGTALASDVDRYGLRQGTGIEVFPSLYAAACRGKQEGLAEHYAYCSAFDAPMLDAWFHLGFGLEQAYAAARLSDMECDNFYTDSLTVRRARAGDEDLLEALSPTVALMQAQAPVWAGAPAKYLKGLREGFRELACEAEGIVLLAFRDAEAVGYQAWFPVPEHRVDGLHPGAIELAVAGTIPQERGSGVGRTLTAHGVSEAKKSGYSTCLTDWRTANPLSSRFWSARGFKPYQYRLARRIAFPDA